MKRWLSTTLGRAEPRSNVMSVATGRFHGALDCQFWDERLLELAIGLEAALLGGDKEGEITYRLRTRAAALLTTDEASPERVFDEIGALYEMRSNLMHGTARQGVVPAAVGLPGVVSAATAWSARDDAADRAQLHRTARVGADTVEARLTLVTLDCTPFDIETSVSETDAPVYSPAVLRLRASPGAKDDHRGFVDPSTKLSILYYADAGKTRSRRLASSGDDGPAAPRSRSSRAVCGA